METFCADLCNLRKDDSIQYAEILSKTVNNNKIIIYNIEGKDEQQMISLSSVLRRVEDVYSTTDDSDFLLKLIAEDYINTYNSELTKSITLQLYTYYTSGLSLSEDENSEDNNNDDFELSEYTNKLFEFLRIEPISKTNIHNIYELIWIYCK